LFGRDFDRYRAAMRSRELVHRPARRRQRAFALLAVAGISLAACGDDDDDEAGDDTTVESDDTSTDTAADGTEPGSTEPAATSAPDATTGGGGDTEASVVVGAVLEPTSLDIVTQAGAALDQVLLDNVYETLLTFEDGESQAGLAELPEISEDGTAYTFTIPEGVTFHDGDPLTASDVVWSLDQSRAETAVAAADLASVTAVTAPDDQTVEVTLSEPDNDLLFNLSRRAGVVLNEGATDLQNTANGTGPFVLADWSQGSSITLERFADYAGEPAGVAEVTFQYYTDPNAAVNALTAGDADLLTGVSTDLVGQFEDDPEYVVTEGTTNGEFTLGFNNSRPPFDDVNVRRALRQAIDKQGFLDLFNGYGTLIGGPVPPTDPWYEDLTDVVPYDPEAARAALEAAGVAEGTSFTLTIPNFYPTTISEYVASQLAEVGVEIEIVPVEFSVWLEQVFTNVDYDLTGVLHVEPRDIGNYANPEYYWRYDNPEVQQLVADAKTAASPDEATDLLKQAARQISEDSPVDWLLLYSDLVVARAGVSGYPQNDTASRFDASGITVED
jgi:peptide/nickel transport system substrate-binding protein